MDYGIITHYFPCLTPHQQAQYAALHRCYQLWNERINVISRKDIHHLYVHHVLHSLAIARFIQFQEGTTVLDVGTGGGFPGIPLAILFPQTQFFLCDSITKKIRVVQEITQTLGLQNVTSSHIRAEEIDRTFDYATSRAVTRLERFLPWIWSKINIGVLYLKGGDLQEELSACALSVGISQDQIKEIPISRWYIEPYFAEKKIIYICKET